VGGFSQCGCGTVWCCCVCVVGRDCVVGSLVLMGMRSLSVWEVEVREVGGGGGVCGGEVLGVWGSVCGVGGVVVETVGCVCSWCVEGQGRWVVCGCGGWGWGVGGQVVGVVWVSGGGCVGALLVGAGCVWATRGSRWCGGGLGSTVWGVGVVAGAPSRGATSRGLHRQYGSAGAGESRWEMPGPRGGVCVEGGVGRVWARGMVRARGRACGWRVWCGAEGGGAGVWDGPGGRRTGARTGGAGAGSGWGGGGTRRGRAGGPFSETRSGEHLPFSTEIGPREMR